MSKFQIFTDFDGTIALNDVGDQLFYEFADPKCKEFVKEWKQGKITAKECLIQECALARVTKRELELYSDSQQIDVNFIDFVSYCQNKHYPITVLSDGLTFYIRRILDRYNLNEIEIYANELIFLDHNQIKPEFPYFEKGCLRCGNCKGFQIKSMKKEGHTIVYIGDGFSDRCGVDESDIIFAKDDLRRYCQQNNFDFFSFNDFKDVLEKLIEIEKWSLS